MKREDELLGWRPGLEGMRGLAILMVMLFHFHATRSWFPGGSLGVDVFFVLSGFLITTLLLEEQLLTGVVSLPAFYRRRARRLLPALFFFLAIFTAVSLATNQPGVRSLPATSLASIFYVFNWLLSFGGSATAGAGHLWSLSVEEQFYLFWPLAAIVTLRISPRALLCLSVLLLFISATLPAWTGRGYIDLYYATDFRIQGLMAGAILAQLRFYGLLSPSLVNHAGFRLVLGLSLVIFGVFLFSMGSRPDFLYRGGYTAAAALSAVILFAALHAPSRILTNAVILYIGSRSYALYLWHHAIAFWVRHFDPVPEFMLSVALSFIAAEMSWQLVERRDKSVLTVLHKVRQRLATRNEEAIALGPPAASQTEPSK